METTAHRHRTRRLRASPWFSGILMLLCIFSCSRGKEPGPEELLRDLPADMIGHLLSSDDSTLAVYGRSVGFVVLSDAKKKLSRRAAGMHAKGREREGSIVDAYNERICRVVAREYDYNLYLDRLIYTENLPRDVRLKVIEFDLAPSRSRVRSGSRLAGFLP